jgi:3-oxoacyl-[acyl-carrier protein] reductase
MLLENKRIIVTGGLTGIGKATVLACAKHGATVVSMSRKAPTDPSAVEMLEQARAIGSGSVSHLASDVSVQEDVDRAFDEAAAQMGGLDAMVNCAGDELESPADEMTAAPMQQLFDVNVLGTAFTDAAAFRHMKDSGGSIINYGSYVGVVGLPGVAAYAASKGAVSAYSRSIAMEWGQYGIRVNVVCPVVMTELYEKGFGLMPPERRAQMEAYFAASIPLGGKPGKAEDSANLNVFLASDMSSFIHGQLIGVDGGMMMPR